MVERLYRLGARNRATAVALGIAVAVLAVVAVISGIALIIGIALIALVLAVGAAIARRIFGTPRRPAARAGRSPDVDPALEVFPPEVREPLPPGSGDARDARAPREDTDPLR